MTLVDLHIRNPPHSEWQMNQRHRPAILVVIVSRSCTIYIYIETEGQLSQCQNEYQKKKTPCKT